MKQPIKFVIGNVIQNTRLGIKLGEAHRDGYRIVSTSSLSLHPGVLAFSMQLVDNPLGPETWVARYAKRTKA